MLITKEEIDLFKELIIWAKDQRVAHIAIGNMQATLFPAQPDMNFNLDDLKLQEGDMDLETYSSSR